MKRTASTTRPLRRALLLSAALLFSAPAQATQAPGGTSISQIWGFVQQLQDWAKSLGDLDSLKDDLFNNVDWQSVATKLGDKLLNLGLDNAGIDVNGIMGNISKWQAAITQAKSDLIKQTQDALNLNFLDSTAQGSSAQHQLGIAPDLAQATSASTADIASNKKKQLALSQNDQTSATTVDQSKKIIEDTGSHAKTTQDNAANLTAAMQNATSTREATQLLGNIMTQNTVATAYNATAITSSLGQVVKAQDVTNQSLTTIANDVLQKRVDQANADLQTIKQFRDNAQAAGDAVGSSVDTFTAAVGGSFSNAKEINDLDGSKLFSH